MRRKPVDLNLILEVVGHIIVVWTKPPGNNLGLRGCFGGYFLISGYDQILVFVDAE